MSFFLAVCFLGLTYKLHLQNMRLEKMVTFFPHTDSPAIHTNGGGGRVQNALANASRAGLSAWIQFHFFKRIHLMALMLVCHDKTG